MGVEEALSTQTEEGLSRRDQVVLIDTDPNVLLLPLDEICGGHAGAVCFALIARLLTVCAVTTQSWGVGRESALKTIHPIAPRMKCISPVSPAGGSLNNTVKAVGGAVSPFG